MRTDTLLFTSNNYRQDFHSNSVQMQNQDMDYIVDFKLLVYNIYIFDETKLKGGGYLRTFDVIMKVIPEGVDKINGAVTCIRLSVPVLKDCKR